MIIINFWTNIFLLIIAFYYNSQTLLLWPFIADLLLQPVWIRNKGQSVFLRKFIVTWQLLYWLGYRTFQQSYSHKAMHFLPHIPDKSPFLFISWRKLFLKYIQIDFDTMLKQMFLKTYRTFFLHCSTNFSYPYGFKFMTKDYENHMRRYTF